MMKQPKQRQKQDSQPTKVRQPDAAVNDAAMQETMAPSGGMDMSLGHLPDHPTARPLREASVLQMQRRFGNSRVQQMVARQGEKLLGRGRQRRLIKKISGKVYGRRVHDPLDAHAATLGGRAWK